MTPVVPETFYYQFNNSKDVITACKSLQTVIGTSVLVVIDAANNNRISLPCDEDGTKWTILNKTCDEAYKGTSKNVENSVCAEKEGIVELTLTVPMTETKNGKSTEKEVTLRVNTDNKDQKVGANGYWAENLNTISAFGETTAKVASKKAEIYNAYPVASKKAAKAATVTPGPAAPNSKPNKGSNVDTNQNLAITALENRVIKVETAQATISTTMKKNAAAIEKNRVDIAAAKQREHLSKMLAIEAAEERANGGE